MTPVSRSTDGPQDSRSDPLAACEELGYPIGTAGVDSTVMLLGVVIGSLVGAHCRVNAGSGLLADLLFVCSTGQLGPSHDDGQGGQYGKHEVGCPDQNVIVDDEVDGPGQEHRREHPEHDRGNAPAFAHGEPEQ